MRTRVKRLRWPFVRRYCLRRFFLKMRTFLPLSSSPITPSDLGARHERGAGGDVARFIADEKDLVERHFTTGVAGVVAVDGDDGARLDTELAARGLDDCKHVSSEISRLKELQRIPHGAAGTEVPASTTGYFRRVLVPFIFCALNVLRKAGSSRSISSKYEERAGVCWLAL